MSYEGFDNLKKQLEKKKGVKSAGAVAAKIGMMKYGKKKFEAAAHAGKKLGHK